jgi:hypothetical protein
MRHTILGLKRSDTDARALPEHAFVMFNGRYATVKPYPDGLVSYGDAPGIVYYTKLIKVPESHPFFNLGVFVQKMNELVLPLHPTTLEAFIKYMKSK